MSVTLKCFLVVIACYVWSSDAIKCPEPTWQQYMDNFITKNKCCIQKFQELTCRTKNILFNQVEPASCNSCGSKPEEDHTPTVPTTHPTVSTGLPAK